MPAPGAPPNSRGISLFSSEVIAMFCSVHHCGPQAVDVTPVAKSHLSTVRVALGRPPARIRPSTPPDVVRSRTSQAARPMGRQQTLSVSARLKRPFRSGH